MHLLTTAFLHSLSPAAAAAIGTLIVLLRTSTAAVRGAGLHFAAGVVFSVVAAGHPKAARRRRRATPRLRASGS